ncbi:MAG: flagellar protein FlaG [Pseudomonadota bacterium]|jgi:flagellar protein FlaG
MSSKVAPVAPASDPIPPKADRPAASPGSVEAKAAAAGPDPVDMRLVIEMDQATGSYVYKTIDRQTGEVLRQLPRDEVLRMRGETDYAAGAVIKTTA